jgi:hypothetical protein
MDQFSIQTAEKLKYIEPRQMLSICQALPACAVRTKRIKSEKDYWRTRTARKRHFQLQAALFCLGKSFSDLKDKWSFALWPEKLVDSPIDAAFRRVKSSGKIVYEYIQLKEVVSEEIDSEHSLQVVLNGLQKKFTEAGGIAIGIYMNRTGPIKLESYIFPKLNGGSIWIFGQGGRPPEDCCLVGDVLNKPKCYFFNYPRFTGVSIADWKTSADEEKGVKP